MHRGGDIISVGHDGIDFAILAFPRSGSSTLRHQLNSFSELVIPPESSFAVWVADRLEAGGPLRLEERFVEAVIASRKFEHWGLSAEEVRSCAPAGPSDTAASLRALYRLYRDRTRPQAVRIGDKNNSHVFRVGRALQVLAPRTALVLWRDPGEVWASYLRLIDVRRSLDVRAARYFPRIWAGRHEMFAAWV